MKLFEGKSPTEKNKIIAAIVFGVMAISAISYTIIFPMIFGGRKVTVNVSASPTPTASPRRGLETVSMPSREDEILAYTTTPINYNPGSFHAPDAGRNIFAFYEPPPPTPYVPIIKTPTPEVIAPPVPTPVPPYLVGFVTPQTVYAGSKSFRLEVNGDKFTPDSLIFLNGNQLPTTFISPQQLVAEVPANFIAGAGAIQILVRTADGGLYSNQISLNVQAPPVPQFRYIGMIARQRFNNDTAYFEEQGKTSPIGARLNDVVGGRFRLMSISASETIFEDVNLGFKHRVALFRPPAGQTTGTNPNANPNDPNNRRNNRMNDLNNPNTITPVYITPSGEIPGIPSNIPIYVQPAPQMPTPPPATKKDQQRQEEDEDGNR